MLSSIKEHATALVTNACTWLAVVTAANKVEIEWWLKIATYVLAGVASAATIWSIVRRDRRESGSASK